MSNWHDFQPTIGWDAFAENEALTDFLRDKLTPEKWHYLNFTADSACWESRQDGSMVQIHYSGSRVAELRAQPGAAADFATLLSSRFRLAPKSTNA